MFTAVLRVTEEMCLKCVYSFCFQLRSIDTEDQGEFALELNVEMTPLNSSRKSRDVDR